MQTQVGIVIVSYNASLAVRATLASLSRAINNTAYKLILVDNASEPAERKLIKKAFDKHAKFHGSSWEYIQLSKNLGFAGGNNVGTRKFMKDKSISHVCLLNSDVILSDNWLDRLVEKGCEAVSAVTNKADSEQCVPVNYHLELADCFDSETESINQNAFETINQFAKSWNQAWKGNLFNTEVTFFCVLLTRGLIDKVGLLDENFFPGGYEDDDYCLRIQKAGIKIFLARDAFMHHFGSASFGQLNSNYFSEKASKNKKYLEKKHNYVCKRRPHKPVDSFAQDILYALKGHGDRQLQKQYFELYINKVSGLIHHYQNEFAAIYAHLEGCNHPQSIELEQNVSASLSYGDLISSWNQILNDIRTALDNNSISMQQQESLAEKLESLASGVYIKGETNMQMHQFLCSVNVFSSGPAVSTHTKPATKLQKFFWLVKKGIPFFWNLRGIVFFGGYPYQEREKDGYFQRIRSIDSLFHDRVRVYVDHMKLPGKDSWYDRPAPNVLVLHVENHRYRWFMKLIVKLCVLKCRTIYFHSVLRMHDSNFGSLMRWSGIRKVIDIHGVVPEEFRMHNDFFSACMYDNHEKTAVSKADHIIFVSNAMHRYFVQKYRQACKAKVIILPIFPTVQSLRLPKPYLDGKPIVVYAGGTHKWQQVPKMIDAMEMTKDFCVHKFFCPDPGEVKAMMPENLYNHPNMLVDSKPFNELVGIYETCHYGFILREDIIVNRAACPTKLVEYVAMGIVPIVDSEEMGDFKELGMQYIHLRDFVAGRLPNPEQRNEMAEANYEVYNKLMELNVRGKTTLQNALDFDPKYVNRKSLIRKIAASIFPKGTRRGELVRKLLKKGQPAHTPEAVQQASTHIAPSIQPNLKSTNEQLPVLPPCDILMQVDNFLVGGLENVVLDLCDTLSKSGLRVNLIVLGEAGVAVERAINSGLTVCVTPYTENIYQHILQTTAPKLVISHYSTNGASICGKMNVPLLQVIHNTYMWFSEEQTADFKAAEKHTTAFIAVSDYVKDYSLARLKISPEKCLVIPNGIDICRFTEMNKEKEREILRKKHGYTDEHFVFLNVGSITHQKNQISTLRAFHTVLKYCPDARLLILGKLYEQQLWHEMNNYITEHKLEQYVTYAGESKNPPAYYAMADAFIHSAFFEGGQLSLLEAIAANLPIVTTEIGFVKHFKHRQGVSAVNPPVQIIDYYGPIWQLTPSYACERDLAKQMLNTYKDRLRPDFDDNVIGMLDKSYTYKLYIELIHEFINTGVMPKRANISWPDLVSSNESIVQRRVPKKEIHVVSVSLKPTSINNN